nr:hypothetical protein Itr_chr01CG00170 [Ipomoea trifida]
MLQTGCLFSSRVPLVPVSRPHPSDGLFVLQGVKAILGSNRKLRKQLLQSRKHCVIQPTIGLSSGKNVSSRSNHRSDVLKVGSSAYEQSIYTAIDGRGNTGPRLQLWKQYVESAHLIPQIAHGAKS